MSLTEDIIAFISREYGILCCKILHRNDGRYQILLNINSILGCILSAYPTEGECAVEYFQLCWWQVSHQLYSMNWVERYVTNRKNFAMLKAKLETWDAFAKLHGIIKPLNIGRWYGYETGKRHQRSD